MGDGFSCSGNLLQVLTSFPSLTNFLMVHTYFASGKEGLRRGHYCRRECLEEAPGAIWLRAWVASHTAWM